MTQHCLKIRISFDSDWHVGSGLSRPGNVDRLVCRDADGLPFVPAKTLRGILRDAAERLALMLDDNQPAGGWSKWGDVIFGSQPSLAARMDDDTLDPTRFHNDPTNAPRGTALFVEPARLPAALRQKMTPLPKASDDDDTAKKAERHKANRARRALRHATTVIKPGVKIDTNNGRAEDQCLRFEELGRVGTVLDCNATLTHEDADLTPALHLLVASTRLIERLGGKRRRGAGRCQVEVVNHDIEAAIKGLQSMEAPPIPQPPTSATVKIDMAKAGKEWAVVPLVLEVRGPVAVAARTVGNVVETLDYVPGTHLLPYVTQVLGPLLNVRGAIAGGALSVMNATREVGGARGRPVPMALSKPKAEEKPFKNFTTLRNALLENADDGKQLRGGYLGAGGPTNPPQYATTPKVVHTHNVIKDDIQRPHSDVGGVYSYEAIAPKDREQPLIVRSELRISKAIADKLPAEWQLSLDGTIRLGSSKKDDYGLVELAASKPVPFASNADHQEGVLFVWLQSDVLLRNNHLRADASIQSFQASLERSLDVQGMLTLVASSVRVRRTDSWQTGWGLPRPSLVGLQAGSCLRFKLSAAIPRDKLRELEASGIGERTAEGFGQVSFNDPLLITLPKDWTTSHGNKEASSAATQEKPLDGSNLPFARLIETAAWKESIRVAALASAKDREKVFKWTKNAPSMSQLGGLRSVLQFLHSRKDVPRVLAWLQAVQDNRRRAGKWPSGSIDKLKELLTDQGRVWLEWRSHSYVSWPELTANATVDLQSELWAYAVRALVDASIRAHKREDVEKKQEAVRV